LGNPNVISLELKYQLVSLTQLTHLELHSPYVNDDGLEYIRPLAKLEQLDLTGTQVRDAGLTHLHERHELKRLYLVRTKVTAAGVAGLQKALPNCKIVWDGGSIEPK